MNWVPHEISIGGVFVTPMLVAALLGIIAAVATGNLMSRHRLARYFFYPPLVILALMVIYTVLIGTFIVPA